jgi:hypothetical protein
VKALRPLWVALRAAVVATAVFWAAIYILDHIQWQAPLGMTDELAFFVIFFLGVLWVGKN